MTLLIWMLDRKWNQRFKMDYVVYDVETQKLPKEVDGGWDNVYGMGMSSAVMWYTKTNRFYFFGHEEEERTRACEFLNGKIAVTFNGITFDSRVLLGNDREIKDNGVTTNGQYSWKNRDIYLAMWKKILKFPGGIPDLITEMKKSKNISKGVFNLDSILWATLRTKKISDGKAAVKMFQEGRMRELIEYNLQDTRCERDLYQFILKHKYLVTGSYDIVTFDLE